jgi:hypothetical protein
MRTLRPIILLLIAVALPLAPPIRAQSDPDAWTTGRLNLRAGPGTEHAVIGQLEAGSALLLQARSPDFGWLLALTADRTARGWIASGYVTYRPGYAVDRLPVRDDALDPNAGPLPVEIAPQTEIVEMYGAVDVVRALAERIDLEAYPLIPDATATARRLYRQGQAKGRDPRAIAKVGDCNSVGYVFLHPFGEGRYKLGDYAALQPVIDRFGASFNVLTQAAHNGMNAAAVLDPLWANPNSCQLGESPLACEYRLRNPAFAVIMFGTNDLLALDHVQFDRSLRRVVVETMHAGIVPVLSTFPRHLALPDRSILFNQIVVRVALDYNLPLINLWRALEPLPGHGIAADGFHLSGPLTSAGDFASAANLETGFPLRNLLTLQALDAVWRGVTGES